MRIVKRREDKEWNEGRDRWPKRKRKQTDFIDLKLFSIVY